MPVKKSVLREKLDEFKEAHRQHRHNAPCFCRGAKTPAQKEIVAIIAEMFDQWYGRGLITRMVRQTESHHGIRVSEKIIGKHLKQCLGGKRGEEK